MPVDWWETTRRFGWVLLFWAAFWITYKVGIEKGRKQAKEEAEEKDQELCDKTIAKKRLITLDMMGRNELDERKK